MRNVYGGKTCFSACPGNDDVITGDGPLPMAIFELLECIVNEVTANQVMTLDPVMTPM